MSGTRAVRAPSDEHQHAFICVIGLLCSLVRTHARMPRRTDPGTFKPGKRKENYPLDDVLEMWEGRENPAATFLPQDQLWQVPLAPPEDILSWLSRIGLLQTDEPEDGDQAPRGDSLLEDEFDLDEDGDAVLGVSEPEGAMMSDDVMS